jgi:hypothetical protein
MEKTINEKIAKLLAEIEDSNNHILIETDSRTSPSEEVLGNVNNHACDVAFFLNQLKKLLTAK